MAWWNRNRGAKPENSAGPSPADVAAAREHLRDFVQTRVGVEMYVEPATAQIPMTAVLIASSGEWTRRRVGTAQAAARLARELDVPVYDVQQLGYPARMRAWTASQTAAQKKRPRP